MNKYTVYGDVGRFEDLETTIEAYDIFEALEQAKMIFTNEFFGKKFEIYRIEKDFDSL